MVLAVLGLLYLLAAIAALATFVVTTWEGASMFDRALELALAASALIAALFLYIAAGNLGTARGASSPLSRSARPGIRQGPAGAATSS